ncbi:MAG: fibronectin type III domain-containing protein [Acidobacteria bacterium]|nr:fibronectin type III domain-containing protein [Acidobacteriota bacterium]
MPHRSTPSLVWLLVVLATLLAAPTWGTTFDVAVGGVNTVFTPNTLDIHVGDTVRWHNAGGFHNVLADDSSFGTTVSSDAWTFTHTFNAAGTFGYYCEQHGSPGAGMSGTIHVTATTPPPPDPKPGAFRFSQASSSVSEAVGQATITVQRVNGSDGAVAVGYSAAAGTATAGQDFTAASGTLTWADGDSGSKTFKVTIVNDTIQEPAETILLALSNPTGGATLDQPTATLSILDNDNPGPSGGPPAAPTHLTATTHSTSEIDLAWTDNASTETGFSIERRSPSGTYQEVGTVGPNVTTFTATGLDAAKLYFFRVRATGASSAFSAYTNEASDATDAVPGPCVAGATTLCVNNGRFKVELDWRTADNTGHGQTVPIPSAPDSGLFYFFAPSNIEMLIKVLNACVAPFNHYWVFFAATTNVEFTTTVTDTQTGKVKVYFNPLNTSAPPVQDVDAFATCP